MQNRKKQVFAFDFESDEEQPTQIYTQFKQKDSNQVEVYAFDDFDEPPAQNSTIEFQRDLQNHENNQPFTKLDLNQQNFKAKRAQQRTAFKCLQSDDQSHDESKKEEQNIPPERQQIQSSKLSTTFAGLQISQNTQKDLEYVSERKALKVTDLKKFLLTSLGDYKIKAIIKRVNYGIFNMSTKFHIFIDQNKKFLFSVLRDGISEYIFSLSKENISRKNKNYLGVLESNMLGTQFKLFDIGFSPKETRSLQHCRKQLATINYESNKGPRKFEVLVATNSQGIHALEEGEDVILKNWKNKSRTNLSKLYSQSPEYDPQSGNFKLDFKGIVKKPSVKNFILGGEQWKDTLIFGKIDEDTFIMEIKSPLSILQATAVCISSIHYKLK